MPLHNTEELKAGPTSQIEHEVHSGEERDLTRFPRPGMIRRASIGRSTISSSSTATRSRTSPPSAPRGSRMK